MVPFKDYHALVMELSALKRAGFTSGPEMTQPAEMPTLPQVVQKAITDLGVDGATERHLVRQAWEMKRAGVAEDDIALRITEGEQVEL